MRKGSGNEYRYADPLGGFSGSGLPSLGSLLDSVLVGAEMSLMETHMGNKT